MLVLPDLESDGHAGREAGEGVTGPDISGFEEFLELAESLPTICTSVNELGFFFFLQLLWAACIENVLLMQVASTRCCVFGRFTWLKQNCSRKFTIGLHRCITTRCREVQKHSSGCIENEIMQIALLHVLLCFA